MLRNLAEAVSDFIFFRMAIGIQFAKLDIELLQKSGLLGVFASKVGNLEVLALN